jgi:hypothetical protein
MDPGRFLDTYSNRYERLVGTLVEEVRFLSSMKHLITETLFQFPVRPHWTKSTRAVFTQLFKNLDQDVSCMPSLIPELTIAIAGMIRVLHDSQRCVRVSTQRRLSRAWLERLLA